MCLACAAALPGTVVADIAGDAARGDRPLRIGHPSGVIELSPVIRREGEAVTVEEVAIYRTARRLMEGLVLVPRRHRSEEHTSELQSLMRNSYAVFCLKKKNIMTRLKARIYGYTVDSASIGHKNSN